MKNPIVKITPVVEHFVRLDELESVPFSEKEIRGLWEAFEDLYFKIEHDFDYPEDDIIMSEAFENAKEKWEKLQGRIERAKIESMKPVKGRSVAIGERPKE